MVELVKWFVVGTPAAAGLLLGFGFMVHGLITGSSADATAPGGEAWKIMWMLDSFWAGFFVMLAGALVSGAILLTLTLLFGVELI